MSDAVLKHRLKEFAQQAQAQLSVVADSEGGVPFDLVSRHGLSQYQPRTDQFIREHFRVLRELPTYGQAVSALSGYGGLDAYLRVHGIDLGEGDAILLIEQTLATFLVNLFSGLDQFDVSDQRLEQTIAALENVLERGTLQIELVAAVGGVRLDGEMLDLGDGVCLVQSAVIDDLPSGFSDQGLRPDVLAKISFSRESRALRQEGISGSHARDALQSLLTTLRLFNPSCEARLSELAYVRLSDGPWKPFALSTVTYREQLDHEYLLGANEESELRKLYGFVRRKHTQQGPIPWALKRFECGYLSGSLSGGLTDYLLCLRNLLIPAGEQSEELFAMRLAAICERPERRRDVVQCVKAALALERAVIQGTVTISEDQQLLIKQLYRYLTAVLRDAVCGHIDSEVYVLADQLLAGELAVRDQRTQHATQL